MQSVQEENALLKRAVEQAPSDMGKLSRQISKEGVCNLASSTVKGSMLNNVVKNLSMKERYQALENLSIGP